MRKGRSLPSFDRCGNEVEGAWFIQRDTACKWQSWDLNPGNPYPTLPSKVGVNYANKATNEPAHIQLLSLSHCSSFFFVTQYMWRPTVSQPIFSYPVWASLTVFLPPSKRCQVHSVKCFQIRVLLCSLSDSLVSTLPSSRNSSLAIAKIFFPSLLCWLVSKC